MVIKLNIKSSKYGKKRKRKTQSKKIMETIRRNIETKDYNTNGTQEMTTTHAFINLSEIAEGHTDNSRDGNQIDAYRLEGWIGTKSSVSAILPTQSRFVIFQWKPDNATAPTAAQILFDTTNQVVYSNFKRDTRTLYKILYDSGPINHTAQLQTYWNTQTPIAVTEDNGTNAYKSFRIKIDRKKIINKVIYNAENTTGVNQFYMMYWSSQATGVNAPDVFYHLRLLYKDA